MLKLREALREQSVPKSIGISNVKNLMLVVYRMEVEGYSTVLIIDQTLKQFGVEIDEAEIRSIVSFLDFEGMLASKEVVTEQSHAS